MRNSRVLSGLVAAAAMVVLVGCGGSTSSSTSDAPAAEASASASEAKPEDQRTSAAEVAVGMKAIAALALQIASAPAAQGKTLSEGIEPLWMPVEGTVQANSQETYDAYEGGFTLLESGDATKAAEGAKAVDAATTAYLVKFPG